MADEVDPIESLVKSHMSGMQQIADTGFEKFETLCNESIVGIKNHSGLRSKIVDNALVALGITEPKETQTV